MMYRDLEKRIESLQQQVKNRNKTISRLKEEVQVANKTIAFMVIVIMVEIALIFLMGAAL